MRSLQDPTTSVESRRRVDAYPGARKRRLVNPNCERCGVVPDHRALLDRSRSRRLSFTFDERVGWQRLGRPEKNTTQQNELIVGDDQLHRTR